MAEADRKTHKPEILEAALALFLERGFDATPTSEIAAVANTAKSNVYHHFRSKDALLWALFEPSFEQVENLIESATDTKSLFEGYLNIMLENRKLATFVINDSAVRSHPIVAEKADKLISDLRKRAAGEGADLESEMRAECALGALRSLIIYFPQADDETVRRVGLEAAKRLLGNSE